MFTCLKEHPARLTLPTFDPDMLTSSYADPEMSELCTSRHSLTPCSFMNIPFDKRREPSREGDNEKERPVGRPSLSTFSRSSMRAVRHALGAMTPDIDAGKQEQPDHVDEVPVPGGEFEAEVLGRREVAGIGAPQADDQEDGADQHVEAVEASRHEEGRAIDIAGELQSR